MKSAQRIPFIVSILFLSIFLLPIVFLFAGSSYFQIGSSTFTFQMFISIMTSSRTAGLLINTLILALGAALVATILGVVYAWITVRTDVPMKRLLELMPILPLAMPFLVKAFSWIYLFSPRIGLVNYGLVQIFGSGAAVFSIYTMGGMIFAMGVGGLPLAYLTVEPAMKAMDPSLEEASRVAGNGIFKTILKVTFPVLLPSILSAFLLLTIISLENFDYPLVLGSVGGIRTLSTEVYFWINGSMPPKYGTAAIISIIFLIVTLSSVSIYIWVTRRAYKFVVVTGKATHGTVHNLRKWRYPAFLVCFGIFFFSFLLPFSTLVLMSFTSFFSTVGGNLVLTFVGLQNYVDALNLPLIYNALINTIGVALAAGLISTLLAAFLSYAALKSRLKGARLIEFIGSIPLAFPGVVYGLALFWTFLLLPGISDLIYGTIWPLVIALIFVRLPYSVRMVSGNLIQMSSELEEASRVSGASWIRTFVRIVLPLMKRGLINSFTYTFVNSMRELGAIVILVTSQSIVLTVLLLNLYASHPLALNTVAAASVMLCLLIFVGLVIPPFVSRLSRLRKSRSRKT